LRTPIIFLDISSAVPLLVFSCRMLRRMIWCLSLMPIHCLVVFFRHFKQFRHSFFCLLVYGISWMKTCSCNLISKLFYPSCKFGRRIVIFCLATIWNVCWFVFVTTTLNGCGSGVYIVVRVILLCWEMQILYMFSKYTAYFISDSSNRKGL